MAGEPVTIAKGAFVGTVSCVQRIAPNGARTRGPTCSLSAVRAVALPLFDVSRVSDCCSCDGRSAGNAIEGIVGCAGRAVAGGDGEASLRGEGCGAGEGARVDCGWSAAGVLGIERFRGCMGRAESMVVDAVADDEEGMRSDGEGGEIWLLAREEGSRLWRASLGSPSQIPDRKFSPRELPPPLTALPALYGRIFVIFALKFTPDLLATQSLPQRLCQRHLRTRLRWSEPIAPPLNKSGGRPLASRSAGGLPSHLPSRLSNARSNRRPSRHSSLALALSALSRCATQLVGRWQPRGWPVVSTRRCPLGDAR